MARTITDVNKRNNSRLHGTETTYLARHGHVQRVKDEKLPKNVMKWIQIESSEVGQKDVNTWYKKM